MLFLKGNFLTFWQLLTKDPKGLRIGLLRYGVYVCMSRGIELRDIYEQTYGTVHMEPVLTMGRAYHNYIFIFYVQHFVCFMQAFLLRFTGDVRGDLSISLKL